MTFSPPTAVEFFFAIGVLTVGVILFVLFIGGIAWLIDKKNGL